jgi:hypothetical protein
VKGEPMPSEDELARRIELSVHMFLAAHAQTPASAESSRRSRVSAT